MYYGFCFVFHFQHSPYPLCLVLLLCCSFFVTFVCCVRLFVCLFVCLFVRSFISSFQHLLFCSIVGLAIVVVIVVHIVVVVLVVVVNVAVVVKLYYKLNMHKCFCLCVCLSSSFTCSMCLFAPLCLFPLQLISVYSMPTQRQRRVHRVCTGCTGLLPEARAGHCHLSISQCNYETRLESQADNNGGGDSWQ